MNKGSKTSSSAGNIDRQDVLLARPDVSSIINSVYASDEDDAIRIWISKTLRLFVQEVMAGQVTVDPGLQEANTNMIC